MRTPAVEITDIFGQDLLHMALIEDEHVVQSLGRRGTALAATTCNGNGPCGSQFCALQRNIPFVLYSGFGDIGGARGEAVHAPKPAPPEVLVTTMEGLLRRPTLTSNCKSPLSHKIGSGLVHA